MFTTDKYIVTFVAQTTSSFRFEAFVTDLNHEPTTDFQGDGGGIYEDLATFEAENLLRHIVAAS